MIHKIMYACGDLEGVKLLREIVDMLTRQAWYQPAAFTLGAMAARTCRNSAIGTLQKEGLAFGGELAARLGRSW